MKLKYTFIFTVKKTTAASSIKIEDLDFQAVTKSTAALPKILPPCDNMNFKKFKVSHKFCGMLDVKIGLVQTRREPQQGLLSWLNERVHQSITLDAQLITTLQNTLEADQDIDQVISQLMERVSVTANKLMKNARFQIWLRENLNTNMHILADQQQCDYHISRFSRSREDFSFFPKIACEDVGGASITVAFDAEATEEHEDYARHLGIRNMFISA